MARIALVCEPPDGGAAEHVAQLVRGLPAHGHEPVLFAPEAFAPAVDFVPLPFRRDYAHPPDDARALARLARELRGFDLVHAHSAKAGVLARLAGWSCAAGRSSTRRTGSRSWARCARRGGSSRTWSSGCSRRRPPRSSASARSSATWRARTSCTRAMLAVVHNGSPAVRCGREAPAGCVVGTVSALRRGKGVDVFLDAVPAILAAVPGAELVIAGDGPQAAELQAHPTPARALGALPRRRRPTTCASSTSTCSPRAGRRFRSARWRRSRAACRRSSPPSAGRARRSCPRPAC